MYKRNETVYFKAKVTAQDEGGGVSVILDELSVKTSSRWNPSFNLSASEASHSLGCSMINRAI